MMSRMMMSSSVPMPMYKAGLLSVDLPGGYPSRVGAMRRRTGWRTVAPPPVSTAV